MGFGAERPTDLYLRIRLGMDPDGALIESWEAMVTAMQVGSAMFAAAGNTEGSVECRIDHKVRTIPAVGPQYFAHPGSWLTAFWHAIVCRDQQRMHQLCSFSLDRLRASEVTIDEFQYHWVDTLQTYGPNVPVSSRS
ncbi:immunity 49 family protein [Streptantibioticus parmotrematis]|uniref:immunity 49 family protein n=1 Tax=Streptantibioticus parmotrematis TaxID=2873249 RepID=UPI0027E14570|nr:immunity 49 family protein [Streptantibioticus parmotrematis]